VPGNTDNFVLRGRRRKRETLDRLLRDVRAGHSRVLVLRGQAAAGRSALLDYLSENASAGRVTGAAGVEPESEIAYSALQQLCTPLLGHLDALPKPQRVALATAFGLNPGDCRPRRRGRCWTRCCPGQSTTGSASGSSPRRAATRSHCSNCRAA
jgi:hypothetical protein